MRVIGLDVGEKRIGVAKADANTRIAIPVGYVDVNGLEWQEIAQVARMNNTNLFVLGLPRSNEGNETAQSLYVRNFAKTLVEQIPDARIRFQDESLTSVVAEERLKSRKKKYEKGDIDAEAAAIILQDFLEGLGNIGAGRVAPPSPDTLKGARLASRSSEGGATLPQTTPEPKTPKNRKKGVIALIVGLLVAGLIAGGVVAGIVIYKDMKAKERAEYYAALEAEMEAATFDFTIRPGETIYDIKANLLKIDRNGKSNREDRLPNYTQAEIDAAFNANYDFAFLQGRPAGATLEGFLYPETHNFYGESTVEEVLKAFLEEMGKVISENDLEQRYSAQGLSLFEGVTLASVVQKEASSPEQPTVAQVFLSRLKSGMPLGSDVTVSYALDTVDPGRDTYLDNSAALKVDSCYNTRLYGGLPCGPISNPGLSALLAVAEPTDTAYLYFLTGDDGLMYYSYTEAEHIQNIYSHCQTLCNVSL